MYQIIETMERRLYPVPNPRRTIRKRPMAVLALGMSRSGTESLREALQMLGYDHVYHGFDVPESSPQTFAAWTNLARRKFGTKRGVGLHSGGTAMLTRADFDLILANYTAITDQQGAIFGGELINAYPDAKVILNWRDSNEWYTSNARTFGHHMRGFRHHVLPYFQSRLYWRKRYYDEVLEAYFHGSLLKNGKWVYEEHCAKISGLMQEKPAQFLRWRVQDGWEPLCDFLGKEVPQQDFPSGNLPAETLSRIGAYLKTDEQRAVIHLVTVVFVVASTIVTIFGTHQFFVYSTNS